MRQGILKQNLIMGAKMIAPCRGLVFVPNFKNTFAFLVNIVTDRGLCKSCMFLCVRSHDPQR